MNKEGSMQGWTKLKTLTKLDLFTTASEVFLAFSSKCFPVLKQVGVVNAPSRTDLNSDCEGFIVFRRVRI